MSLGTFEPEGFSFTEAGGAAILKELEEQVDAFVDQNVSELLEYILEKDEHNSIEFQGDLVAFSVYHGGEFYTFKTPLLKMVDHAFEWLDPEPMQQTLQTLKEAVRRMEQSLADRAARK